ncbi:MRP-1 protein, partial [Aphelenchoides avenae]
MALGMVMASSTLHEGMLSNMLRSTMSFFDVTPLGRILNRFSKDVDMMDTRVPGTVINFVSCVVQGIAILCVPMIVTPAFASVIAPTIAVYILLT